MKKILEYVEFKANKGVASAEVISALRATDPILAEIQGFEKRDLAVKENWFVEVVYWRDQASAITGLEQFKSDSRSQRLFELIDTSSVVIRYFERI